MIDTVARIEHAADRQRRALADEWKRTKLENLALLLKAAIEAQGRVGIMLNVRRVDLDGVLALLPALQRPTISALSDERLGRGQHDHRGADRARADPEAESGERAGNRRVSAQQDCDLSSWSVVRGPWSRSWSVTCSDERVGRLYEDR